MQALFGILAISAAAVVHVGTLRQGHSARSFSPRMQFGSHQSGAAPATPWSIKSVSPDGALVQRVEGKTRKTWKFSDLSKDRVQVALASEGRPINSDVQLWLGPDWTPFTLKAYTEDGKIRPIMTVVGTRNKAAMVEVRNVGEFEFPFSAAANYAQEAMATVPVDLPACTPGERVDGGALRSFSLDSATEQVEVVLKTDGRQLNARIELLNGPNNAKQTYEVFTNNGDLNSLCVAFHTPDPATTVRVVNCAPVEFPCQIHIKESGPGGAASPQALAAAVAVPGAARAQAAQVDGPTMR